jgi:hypothetical protein
MSASTGLMCPLAVNYEGSRNGSLSSCYRRHRRRVQPRTTGGGRRVGFTQRGRRKRCSSGTKPGLARRSRYHLECQQQLLLPELHRGAQSRRGQHSVEQRPLLLEAGQRRRRHRLRVVSRKPLGRTAVAAMAALIATPTLACAPSVHADPVDTTAAVLKVVDGDTVDIRDDVRGRAFESDSSGSTHRRRRSPATPSAAGDQRRPSSRSRHCSGSASHSSPTRRKT